MTHHIVGFREDIPYIIMDTSTKFSVEFGLLWPPNVPLLPGEDYEFNILAGWTIRREVVG